MVTNSLNLKITDLEETAKKAEKRVEQIKEQVAVLKKAKGAFEMLMGAGHGNTDDGKEVIASIEQEITKKEALLVAFAVGKEAADIAIRQGKERLEEDKKEGVDGNGQLPNEEVRSAANGKLPGEKEEKIERISLNEMKDLLESELKSQGKSISFEDFNANFNGRQQALLFLALRSRVSISDEIEKCEDLKDDIIERSKLIRRLAYTEYVVNQAVVNCLEEVEDGEEDEG